MGQLGKEVWAAREGAGKLGRGAWTAGEGVLRQLGRACWGS